MWSVFLQKISGDSADIRIAVILQIFFTVYVYISVFQQQFVKLNGVWYSLTSL